MDLADQFSKTVVLPARETDDSMNIDVSMDITLNVGERVHNVNHRRMRRSLMGNVKQTQEGMHRNQEIYETPTPNCMQSKDIIKVPDEIEMIADDQSDEMQMPQTNRALLRKSKT